MVKLNSGIKREIKQHFVLDEAGIRKIVKVLESQATSLTQKYVVVFAVHREDDRFYETTNVDDVVGFANREGQAVQSLTIQLRPDDPSLQQPWEDDWIVEVAFEREEKPSLVTIEVNATDKNWALVLADALEPQVQNTISKQKIPSAVIWVLCAALLYLANVLVKRVFPATGVPADVGEWFQIACWVGAATVSFNTAEDRPAWVTNWAGPLSSFNWGEQAALHQSRVERQKNVFWVVIVGLVLSLASTAITTYTFPQLPPEAPPPTKAVSSP